MELPAAETKLPLILSKPALNPGQPKIFVLRPMTILLVATPPINAFIRAPVMPTALTTLIIPVLLAMLEPGITKPAEQPALSAETASNAMVLPAPARMLPPKPATAARLTVMIVFPEPAPI